MRPLCEGWPFFFVECDVVPSKERRNIRRLHGRLIGSIPSFHKHHGLRAQGIIAVARDASLSLREPVQRH